MTKTISIALVLALAGGCKDKKKDPAPVEPAPLPTAGSGSGSGSAMTPTTPTTPTTGSGSAVAAGCELALTIDGSSVSWKTATSAGAMADGIDAAKITETAKTVAAAGPCTATISADDKVVYQDVITVMDAVTAGGIKDVGLEFGGPDMPKPTVTGPPPAVKEMPVVVITTDTVMLNSKELGKLADAKLDAVLAAAFADAKKASPAGHLILQADKGTTWANLAKVVGAAYAAGFGNVLFAVKNK
jgi:biopolymer transport protein ExbD